MVNDINHKKAPHSSKGAGLPARLALAPAKRAGRHGFTLIELATTSLVIVMLVGMVLIYNKRGEGQLTVFREQIQLQNIIFKAKASSIQTLNQPNTCGYGVHFVDATHYTLYRSTIPNCKTNSDPYLSADILERYTLATGISVSPLNIADILFVPPDPTTVLRSPGGILQSNVTITISNSDGSATATITLNNFGQITL